MQRQSIMTLIKKRREEAKRQGRLIAQEPLLEELRKRRRHILPENSNLYLFVKRAGDFAVDVLTQLRSMDLWASLTASEIAGDILAKVIKL